LPEPATLQQLAGRDAYLDGLLGVHHGLLTMVNRLNATFSSLPDVPIAGPALPPLLLSQAHSAFLAGVRMALAGQVHVAYMALRGCIESALYALIMKQQASSRAAWLNREMDRALCRRIFTAASGLALLMEIDAPLARVFEESYESTIDRGAHPNVLSLGSHLDFNEWDKKNNIANILLLPDDDTAVKKALHCCIVVGAAVASLCAYVMPDHRPAAAAQDEAMEVIDLYFRELGH
jgi:hypothetical protein